MATSRTERSCAGRETNFTTKPSNSHGSVLFRPESDCEERRVEKGHAEEGEGGEVGGVHRQPRQRSSGVGLRRGRYQPKDITVA